jgi:hypothetical protein
MERIGIYMYFGGKARSKRPLKRPRPTREDNIKMDLREI